MFTITKLESSKGPHLDSKAQMDYGIECLEPNWYEGFLVNLRDQITKCNTRKYKQFGYGSFLLSFFLEWAPLIFPWIEMPISLVSDSWMEGWTGLIDQLGGGPQFMTFDVGFFEWWESQIP